MKSDNVDMAAWAQHAQIEKEPHVFARMGVREGLFKILCSVMTQDAVQRLGLQEKDNEQLAHVAAFSVAKFAERIHAYAALQPKADECDAYRDRCRILESRIQPLEERLHETTESLRKLSREHDPKRSASMIEDGIATATVALNASLEQARSDNAKLMSEINEVRASKRKLKEAYERLKEGRK